MQLKRTDARKLRANVLRGKKEREALGSKIEQGLSLKINKYVKEVDANS